MNRQTDAFSSAMRRYTIDQQAPWVDFVKGEHKDERTKHQATQTGIGFTAPDNAFATIDKLTHESGLTA